MHTSEIIQKSLENTKQDLLREIKKTKSLSGLKISLTLRQNEKREFAGMITNRDFYKRDNEIDNELLCKTFISKIEDLKEVLGKQDYQNIKKLEASFEIPHANDEVSIDLIETFES